jgi:kynurenine formamidase
MLTEPEVVALFERCSNKGRWGDDDECGTLNFITPEKRLAAVGMVRNGHVISLGKDLNKVASRSNPDPVVHRMLYLMQDAPFGCIDVMEIAPHGFSVTHMDGVGHVYFDGETYNGRRASQTVTAAGMSFGSVRELASGVFTRGVLLDVAGARGVPWLTPDEGIMPDDLDRAELYGRVRVETGDAIFVRAGLGARVAAEGEEDPSARTGLLPECLPWLYEHEIAVYSGDCIEKIPLPYERAFQPLHMIGLGSMGLVMIDNPDIEELNAYATRTGRYEFLLTCAPLRLPGGTASPINPIAVF